MFPGGSAAYVWCFVRAGTVLRGKYADVPCFASCRYDSGPAMNLAALVFASQRTTLQSHRCSRMHHERDSSSSTPVEMKDMCCRIQI